MLISLDAAVLQVSMYVDCPTNLTLAGVTLLCPTSEDLARFERAVRRGLITWHAGQRASHEHKTSFTHQHINHGWRGMCKATVNHQSYWVT